MKAPIYNTSGKEVGEVSLPEAVFGAKRNDALVHQVVTAMMGNARTVVAHTKDRGAVRGGGKKPWKQKGTGRARHGSRRSPLWRGGGTTFGPSAERNFEKKVNKKMRAKALAIVLSGKLRSGEVMFVDSLTFAAPKAKDARMALTGLGKAKGFAEIATRRKNAALIALTGRNTAVEKSFRNFGNVEVVEARNLNPVSVLSYRYLVIVDAEEAVKGLAARMKA